MGELAIRQFSNQSREDWRLLHRFVDFHWEHYRNDPQYIPLLDYEYLGSRLLGITGFFEPRNLFFKHADMTFLLAERDGKVVGRCNVFVNHSHNEYWREKAGFFGQFEAVEDPAVTARLLEAAGAWLKERGMETIRGPQNLPVNEATPGAMTEGFDSRPMIYYHYNKPFYADLLKGAGLEPVMRYFAWEVPVFTPLEEKLTRIARIVQKRSKVTLESWAERPLEARKREMFEVYNDAWGDNFGFVPFTFEEFEKIIEDQQLVIDKKQYLFAYVDGEPAGFFGAVPNILEKMRPLPLLRRFELLRAARMILTKGSVSAMRLGYLGVRKKYRQTGLPALMLWHQKQVTQSQKHYQVCDIGWVLETNDLTNSMVKMMEGHRLSKVYTMYEKPL